MRGIRIASLLPVVVAVLAACTDKQDRIGPDTSSSGAGTSAGVAGAAGGPHCPTDLPGPALVEVPAADGSPYCIDATEVTQAQYADFLAAASAGKAPDQRKECAWNTTFEPKVQPSSDQTLPGCPLSDWDPKGTPDAPVVCVDACDAFAYCAWAGKRLCGRVGGGSLPNDGSANPRAEPDSQWYWACSQGGKTAYSYGDAYIANACEGAQPDAKGELVATESADTACRGQAEPYSSIRFMSGNVWEWEDACIWEMTDKLPDCAFRGGQWNSGVKATRCDTSAGNTPGFHSSGVGFRCCRD